jgi:hypothetical protein
MAGRYHLPDAAAQLFPRHVSTYRRRTEDLDMTTHSTVAYEVLGLRHRLSRCAELHSPWGID